MPLRLPPLRERVEDIPDLVRHFLRQAERRRTAAQAASTATRSSACKRYRWPGNVRELENLARRLAALYPQETITAAVIDNELAPPAPAPLGDEGEPTKALSAAVERHLTQIFRRLRRRPAAARPLPPHPAGDRIPAALCCLAATRGNQIRAADLLGVNRNTLRKKIRDLEIQVSAPAADKSAADAARGQTCRASLEPVERDFL